MAEVDNTQAIAAVARGHSKKLRHVARTQRVSIVFLHDVQGGFGVRVEYVRSEDQRADVFTKSLPVATFLRARSMVGVESAEDVDRMLSDPR